MRADSVMALGALRLPNTSDPEPLKSNTALPYPREKKGVAISNGMGLIPEASTCPTSLPNEPDSG